MDSEVLTKKLKDRFGDALLEFDLKISQPYIRLSTDHLIERCEYLKNDPELAFDFLMCLSGVDWKDSLEVVYHLYSFTRNHKLVIKVKVDRDNPKIPSVSSIWRTADWHEREAYDLFGIIFEGHPDLRRILLPEDWEGYPLRKDYVPQKKYKGFDLT